MQDLTKNFDYSRLIAEEKSHFSDIEITEELKEGCSETAKLDRFWLEFSAVILSAGGAENDESLEVFGRPEGVHSQAGR